MAQLLPVATAELEKTLHMPANTAESAERQAELQGLLCGVVQVAVSKLMEGEQAARAAAAQAADGIMAALLRVFACRPGSVHEEAMLAVGSLTYAAGRSFAKYMDAFFPVLERGLQQAAEWQVCQVSVGVLGDLSRAIEEQLFPYCDRIMLALLANLQSDEVHRTIKPQILSAFGDIALAIGDRFDKYLAHVVQMLQSAMALSVQQAAAGAGADEDRAAYNNLLRQGVLEAWAGAFNGLSRAKADAYLVQYAPGLLDFIEAVAGDTEGADSGVWKSCAALIGDIASSLTGVGALFAQKPFVSTFLQRCAMDPACAETAHWAGQMVGKASQSGQNVVQAA